MKTYTIPLTLIALGLFALVAVIAFKPLYQTYGAAFTGSASYLQSQATTSLTANTNTQLLAAKTDGSCKARVVTVPGSVTGGIMLSFGNPSTGISSTTLSAVAGHWQAASTTEVYDSGLFGCGLLYARSWTTGVVTVSEF